MIISSFRAGSGVNQGDMIAHPEGLIGMMRRTVSMLCLLMLLPVGTALGQTTRPAPSLETLADEAFARKEYAVALPMLEKIAAEATGDADRFGRIQQQIRVCQTALETAAPTTAPTRRTLPAPDSAETLDIPLKDLGDFEYDASTGGNIPDDVKRLNGVKLRVRGFMLPMAQADNVTQFAMVPDQQSCCFGQQPLMQNMLLASLPEGKSVSYFSDELLVEGTLHVEEKREDGFIVSVFQMDVTSVRPSVR
jgi:hypothetical protein